jgi:hypothetical protein
MDGWALINSAGNIVGVRRTRAECIDYARWLASGRTKNWRWCKRKYNMSVARATVSLRDSDT